MAMASGRLRTPGKRVHSEPTRRPIVRSGALELAGAKRAIQRSLLRSTVQWTRALPSLLLAGGAKAVEAGEACFSAELRSRSFPRSNEKNSIQSAVPCPGAAGAVAHAARHSR